MTPGGVTGGPPAGVNVGPRAWAPPGSHAARMRNCSFSRPRVTGDENSTRSRRGEFSSNGISALAAAAWPVSSTPFWSNDAVVSQVPGRQEVGVRSRRAPRAAGRKARFSTPVMVPTSLGYAVEVAHDTLTASQPAGRIA